MWCDNCLLVLPLRAGAMAWAVFIAAYSIAGGLFLFVKGQYLFFLYPEWQIYGGVAMGVASCAVLSALALSNSSYTWTRVVKFLWPFVIVISAVRAIAILVELQRGKDKIAWECSNGGQLWTDAPVGTTTGTGTGTLPLGFCGTGFENLYSAFLVSMVADLGCQMYMFFLMWRFSKRLEHYSGLKGPGLDGGYYS